LRIGFHISDYGLTAIIDVGGRIAEPEMSL
jgi:hypothetical protein